MKSRRATADLFFDEYDLRRMGKQVQDLLDLVPDQIPTLKVSEYAAENRILPQGTPYPGKWRNELTPYLTEIMDNLSARSPIEETSFIKASQIGATAAVENFIAYIIDTVPGPAMYVSAKEDLLRKWANKRFNPLIKYCGLGDKIFKQHTLKSGRATGNQQFSKEFPGGSLDIVSAQSESNLRMDSIRYLIMDEAGAYPWNVQGFGDPIEIARARTANFGSRKKIFIPSTAGIMGECRMWDLYQEGDRRRYFVPCMTCGEGFVFKFPSEPDMFYDGIASAPIEWETKAGILDPESIHFKCPHCGARNTDAMKWKLVSSGEWKPTAEPHRKLVRSYQIGRLYSLMDTWERLVLKEINSVGDPLLLQSHHNHNCGIPYLESTQRPDISKIYELRGYYGSGEIPSQDVLFVTAAVDVQRGKENDPTRPARLEMEVCGHGYAYRTWSLQYKVFEGSVTDPYGGAWEKLYDYVANGGLDNRRADGFVLSPRLIFIDSGDGDTETVVFDFCTRMRGTYPVKGAAELKKTAAGKKADTAFDLDERGPRDRDRFRVNMKHDQQFVMILTNWYKNGLWRALKIPRQPTGEQRPRFCEFPRDYPDRYFDMLVAEERRDDGSFWKPEHRNNESLDLRVYNMAAADFWLHLEVQRMKKDMIAKGFPKEQADYVKTRHVIDLYTKLAKKGPKRAK